jgi:hypothetical protein
MKTSKEPLQASKLSALPLFPDLLNVARASQGTRTSWRIRCPRRVVAHWDHRTGSHVLSPALPAWDRTLDQLVAYYLTGSYSTISHPQTVRLISVRLNPRNSGKTFAKSQYNQKCRITSKRRFTVPHPWQIEFQRIRQLICQRFPTSPANICFLPYQIACKPLGREHDGKKIGDLPVKWLVSMKNRAILPVWQHTHTSLVVKIRNDKTNKSLTQTHTHTLAQNCHCEFCCGTRSYHRPIASAEND